MDAVFIVFVQPATNSLRPQGGEKVRSGDVKVRVIRAVGFMQVVVRL